MKDFKKLKVNDIFYSEVYSHIEIIEEKTENQLKILSYRILNDGIKEETYFIDDRDYELFYDDRDFFCEERVFIKNYLSSSFEGKK